MEEHDTKINHTYISPTEGHQVTEIAKYNEVYQDSLALGEEDDYYSSEEDACGGRSGTGSELDDDGAIPNTQEHVFYPRSNGGHLLYIWSHSWLKFINNATITAYCLSPLKFVYEHEIRNAYYSHALACDR